MIKNGVSKFWHDVDMILDNPFTPTWLKLLYVAWWLALSAAARLGLLYIGIKALEAMSCI